MRNFRNFSRKAFFFHGYKKGQIHQISWKELVIFFTHTRFHFHVCDLEEIFTYTIDVFTGSFQDFFTEGKKIHVRKSENRRKFSRKRF